MPDFSNLPGVAAVPRKKATRFVPTIAFHGDADGTVGLGNGAVVGAAVLNRMLDAARSNSVRRSGAPA